MIASIDWAAFALGLLAGSAAGALFFAGLAIGMRLALRRARPAAILLLSAAIRIALLLAAGWGVAGLGATALAGFALAFTAVRFAVLTTLRVPAAEGRA